MDNMFQKNYKMIITYDGTRYFGWEHQPGKDTIQGKLEDVINHLSTGAVEIIGAGRTDAGVHAKGMVANFKLLTDLSAEELRNYINKYLPDDISVTELKEASERFHSRYNAIGKTYCYTCYDGNAKPIFNRKYVWKTDDKLNVENMRIAAGYLIGEHDFRSFCKATCKNKSAVRTIDKVDIVRKGDYVYFSFHGNGFLRNMVRILVGTLVEVGLGKRSPDDIRLILEMENRVEAGKTAPACGLCLMQVDYD